ncbi:Peroxidasin [Apis cerana cerana]|uniref:Peroxidasin n=1 Tax=Apis cerana cerana TaxID=94128 RepID=A0A2A3ERY5_APICC|nr:Peroxidasin [Apis cerana cerana]
MHNTNEIRVKSQNPDPQDLSLGINLRRTEQQAGNKRFKEEGNSMTGSPNQSTRVSEINLKHVGYTLRNLTNIIKFSLRLKSTIDQSLNFSFHRFHFEKFDYFRNKPRAIKLYPIPFSTSNKETHTRPFEQVLILGPVVFHLLTEILGMELRTAKLLLYSTLMVVVCWSQEYWTAQCASSCKCRWISGKKAAECIRQNLSQIPVGLSPEIQNFDLTGNRITYLMHESFSRVHLVNLQKLVLRKCEIELIHTDAFNGLKIVIEIDLSANNIGTLYPGTFEETQRLRVLLLNDNKLKVLENGLFHNLKYLQKVELSNNELERIDDKTFRNLPELRSLTLDANNLSALKVQSFDTLPKLGSLELHNNPWNCNCRLKRFRDWTIEKKLYTKPTTCQQPESLAGKMWDEISSDEFACRPEIFTIGPSVKVEVGKGNVTFWCRASGIPRPQLSWVHRSRVINNHTRRHNGEKIYILKSNHEWLNLTIPDVAHSDKGDYVCLAKSPGGNTEKNVTLTIAGDALGGKDNIISLPLALGLGVTALLLLIVTVTLCVCYCRRRRIRHDEKSLEAASMEHHGLGEQEKSLITTINPVVKPPRRYEAPSVTSHGTEMTELNRTLLDNDSVFGQYTAYITKQCVARSFRGYRIQIAQEFRIDRIYTIYPRPCTKLQLDSTRKTARRIVLVSTVRPPDGIGGGVGSGVIGGVGDDEREERATPELESGTGTLCRGGGGSYRQYPPDLLAFSGGRGASPTSQASTAPDNTRLPSQHATPTTAAFGSPLEPISGRVQDPAAQP